MRNPDTGDEVGRIVCTACPPNDHVWLTTTHVALSCLHWVHYRLRVPLRLEQRAS